jgi:ElaB/YqjD/DUF883 family membrane-anchored ribosome-binding protein
MAKPGQHPPIAEQLDELIGMIESAENDDGPNARQVAEKGRRIVALGRELARDIAELTRHIARHDADIVAQYVRDRPLTSVAAAGAAGAMFVCLLPHSRRHRHY